MLACHLMKSRCAKVVHRDFFCFLSNDLVHRWIFRYKGTKGGNDGKRRHACLGGKRPAAFRNL